MASKIDRAALIELIRKIMSAECSEKERDASIERLNSISPHPSGSDLIFYAEEEMTPEEIADAILSYETKSLNHEKK